MGWGNEGRIEQIEYFKAIQLFEIFSVFTRKCLPRIKFTPKPEPDEISNELSMFVCGRLMMER